MPIIPTVGRQVWYFGGAENPGKQVPEGVPLAATVAYVHPNGKLNLQVIDSEGIAHSRLNVPLAQDDEKFTIAHAEWMPYQKQKAAEWDKPEPVVEGPGFEPTGEFDAPPAIPPLLEGDANTPPAWVEPAPKGKKKA